MRIEILDAGAADYVTVTHLSSYYIYDLSEYLGWACPESGCFGGCDDFFADWRAGRNRPYLLRVDGELAGFAGVVWDETARERVMQEFFVLRKFRRRGVGRAAAVALFDRFPGRWRVEQLVANRPAMAFWPAIIRDYLRDGEPAITRKATDWGEMQVIRFANG